MLKKIAISVILITFIPLIYADDAADRGHAVLRGYYHLHDKDVVDSESNRVRINWSFAACVLFEQGEETRKADKVLRETLESQKTYFSDRGSPGHDLYWELVILCRMVNSPEIMAKLSEEADQSIKAVLWDFIHSFDREGRTSFDTAKINMIFNSDNHDMIHRCIFLMAAQALKNDSKWKDMKYQDSLTPAQHYEAWCKNMLEYFRFRAMTGVNVEFASSVYAALYVQPIFNLYDYCENVNLRKQAGKFLTLFFADVGQEVLDGVRGGARVRVYKTETAFNYWRDRLLSYNHILADKPAKLPRQAPTDCFTAANSEFRLPDIVRNLISETDKKGSYIYKSNRLAQGSHVLGGEYEVGSRAPIYTAESQSSLLRYTYATPKYILGSFTVDETKRYMLINSQNQWMGLTTISSPQSRVVVHVTPTSDSKTGYRELQAVQSKGCAMYRKQLAANDTGLMRLYISDDFEVVFDEAGKLFFENDSVYLAVICGQSKGQTDHDIAATDLGPGRFVTFNRPDVFIVTEVAMKSQYEDVQAFIADVSDNKLKFENNNDIIKYGSSKNDCELTMFTYNKLPQVNGVEVDVRPEKVYSSPYILGYYNNSKIQITGIEGKTLVLDFDYNQDN